MLYGVTIFLQTVLFIDFSQKFLKCRLVWNHFWFSHIFYDEWLFKCFKIEYLKILNEILGEDFFTSMSLDNAIDPFIFRLLI